MRETSRDYRHPHRPPPIRWLNQLGKHLTPSLVDPLDFERMVRAAVRAEGHDHFGPDPWEHTLRHLLAAIEAEGQLHFLGQWITQTRLIGVLRARLAQQAIFERRPDILHTPVTAPVVITGLQRTGTTFLQRLLAADPRFRALQSWETLRPAPLPREIDGRKRRAQARQATRALAYLAPDFLAVHPVEADQPEEEVVLLEQTFLSTVSESILHVPSHGRWLETQDQAPAYHLLKKVLQLLSQPSPARRWVLKTPHHLEYLDVLWSVFPDARVIHTHRDPITTLASFCSMVAHGRGLCTDHVDPHEVGRYWLRKTARMLDCAINARDAASQPVLDVHYDALMQDPLAVLDQIYAFLDLTRPPEVDQALEILAAPAHRHRYGRHVYDLSDFGLTETQVAEAHQRYRARFLSR